MIRIGQLTVTIDPEAQAIYIYLRPREGFRSYKQEEPAPGVIVDFDANGKPIGIELLGPGKLDIVVKKVAAQYRIPGLKQILQKREEIEELLGLTN